MSADFVDKTTKSRGDATSKAHRAGRQAKVVEMMNDGKTQKEAQEALGVSRMTFWRDIQAIEARFVQGSTEDVKKFKQAQYASLIRLEEAVIKGDVPAEVGNTLIRIRDAVSKLLGLNAPERRLVAHANVEHSPEFLLFREAVAGLDEDQVREVYRFAKALKREWTAPAIEADFPKPEEKEERDAS
jgi:hypothetical protein